MSVENFVDFALAVIVLLVVLLALGRVEHIVARRTARLSPLPAMPRPFEASTDTIDPTARQPAGR